MAAPPFVPVDPTAKPRTYSSPAHVPDSWCADRPADIVGRQPEGPQLGKQGPDQGYALALAERLRDRVVVADGEVVDDALAGCLGIALRRASLYGRAPVMPDLTLALTIWGYLDPAPPADLVDLRRPLFEGVANATHHYAEARSIVDSVPESPLRMSPGELTSAYPARWRELLGR